jgi:dUTP pyrophosphatase
MKLKFKKLHPEAVTPRYATTGAACFDLHAIYPSSPVFSGAPITINTGLAFEVPAGHVMMIFSRSGHGFNHDTRLANCVGILDSDYRGEVMVRLTRDSSNSDSLKLRHGDRIAQAMIVPIPAVELIEGDLSDTERGSGGFGSTGA